MPELDENDQRDIIGGSGSCLDDSTTYLSGDYTWDEMYSMVEAGTWGGGTVGGLGYIGGISTLTGTYTVSPESLTDSEEDHSVMLGALAISATLLADDITGIGVVDDVAIPFILGGAAIYEGGQLVYKYMVTNDHPSYGNFGDPRDWTYTVPSQPFYEIPPVDNGDFGPEGASKWWLIPGGAALAKGIKDGNRYLIDMFLITNKLF